MTVSRTKTRLARVGIIILFLALIRCIGEYFRLKYVAGSDIESKIFEPFLKAAFFLSVCALIANLFYFFNRMTMVIVIAAIAVICLFIYKLVFMGA